MKNLVFYFSILLVTSACSASTDKQQTSPDSLNEAVYDSALAMQVGADDFGMKQYVMAFLKSGPNRNHDSATVAELQRAHLDNIKKMANEGKLVVAGPFMDSGEIRGIYIFDVKTIEEAKALTATDPAIQAGRLEMELHRWYGSAALKKVNEITKRIAKKEI